MVEIQTPQDVHDIIEDTIKNVRDSLIEDPEIEDVNEVEDINNGYCLFVANEVAESLDDLDDLVIYEGGGMGFLHIWVAYQNVHYDAEDPEGAPSPEEMSYFKRHGRFDYHEVGIDFVEKFRKHGKGD